MPDENPFRIFDVRALLAEHKTIALVVNPTFGGTPPPPGHYGAYHAQTNQWMAISKEVV